MGQRWSLFPWPSARHQFALQDHGYEPRASCGVSVYVPALAGTQCAYPRRDGQAELTCVAGHISRWFTHLPMVTHSSTNRARCSLISLHDQRCYRPLQTATVQCPMVSITYHHGLFCRKLCVMLQKKSRIFSFMHEKRARRVSGAHLHVKAIELVDG